MQPLYLRPPLPSQNILAGALFGVRFGLPLVCLLTAIGASLCYTISRLFGRKLVLHYLGHRLQPLQERLNDDQRSLLFILLSLRLFPMSPNWFLNISSPILGIPLHLFFVSVLLGQYHTRLSGENQMMASLPPSPCLQGYCRTTMCVSRQDVCSRSYSSTIYLT